MNLIPLEILNLTNSQQQNGTFNLLLGEVGGPRRLMMAIGMFEAQAIAIEIERFSPTRPMTHDLFKSFAEAFSINLEQIVITNMREGIFFAKLVCTDGGNEREIDSRPSDAIALALRFHAPIMIVDTVLDDFGHTITDTADEEQVSTTGSSRGGGKSSATAKTTSEEKGKGLHDLPLDQLKKMLEDALQKEDYERAAKIRDELNKRN